MNPLLIGRIIGGALCVEAGLMTLPLGCALFYHEDPLPLVLPMAIAAGVGILLVKAQDEDQDLVSREGFISTGLTWIALSLVGMLPFLISGAMHNPIDAFFETVSAFTTTGSTVLSDIEALPHGILMWRSFMHWIGGMGILVFMAAIMHFAGGSQMNLIKAESTGPVISKLLPKAGNTAKVLYAIYTAMTVLTLAVLLCLDMPVFDAICLTFSAAGTGGFGVLNDSCASYTIAQQIALNISMMSFGVSFTLYFLLLAGKTEAILQNEELRLYLGLFFGASVLICIDLMLQGHEGGILYAFHEASFHVGSIMTTTGFATVDCNLWPRFSQGVLMILMMCGACAGSTGGGIKLTRIVIMIKAFNREMACHLRPEMIKKIHIDGKVVDDKIIRNTGTYTFIFFLLMILSMLLVSIDGKSWEMTISAVLATFNNIGPGIGDNGTMGNYSSFSNFAKVILSADMLIGRLEIFPILALFRRTTWRRF